VSRALLLTNIGQLLTLRSGERGPRRGGALRELDIIEDAAVLCAGGQIVSVGRAREAKRDAFLAKYRRQVEEIDCGGRVALPGFVDSHTHPAFAAPRLDDFDLRVGGASYEEIAQRGGGIRSSVGRVRKATRAELAARVLTIFETMARQGTTTVEAKSGYGLSMKDEIKSLEAIRDAAARWAGTVLPTFLGAHVVPQEYRQKRAAYVRAVCKQMIPQIAKRKLAAFCDVYCDHGAFTLAETEQILESATSHGLGARAHVGQFRAEQVRPLLRFKPASLDHMDQVLDDDLPQLARHETVVTLLPASNYFLGSKQYPPARKLISAGVPMALATDCNPGTAPTVSMPFVLSLACTQMGRTPAEALAATTINAAHALRLADRKGSIEPGKDADLAIFDAHDWRELAYWIAGPRCWATVMNGTLQSVQ
jgi:imidazolonepropionase